MTESAATRICRTVTHQWLQRHGVDSQCSAGADVPVLLRLTSKQLRRMCAHVHVLLDRNKAQPDMVAGGAPSSSGSAMARPAALGPTSSSRKCSEEKAASPTSGGARNVAATCARCSPSHVSVSCWEIEQGRRPNRAGRQECGRHPRRIAAIRYTSVVLRAALLAGTPGRPSTGSRLPTTKPGYSEADGLDCRHTCSCALGAVAAV